jgi:hypothetical protein
MGRDMHRTQNIHSLEINHDRVWPELDRYGIAYAVGKLVRQCCLTLCQPFYKKPEPVPTLKSATRLLSRIFSDAKSIPEFQRQVVTPVIPKFSLALVGLVQNHADIELQVALYPCNYGQHPTYGSESRLYA